MAKIAFCGLGRMGTPMATRLIEAGHELRVWNRDNSKTEGLAGKGATVANSPREAAEGCEIAITMLATPEALQEVLLGHNGLVEGLDEGAILIEMSTVGPETIHKVAQQLNGKVALLDAPVRGSMPQATAGQLRIVVGGASETFEKVKPVLEGLGQPALVGPSGAGASVKLLLNAALLELSAALGEILALSDAMGIDQKIALDELSQTALGGLLGTLRPGLEAGNFPPNFALPLARKDMTLVRNVAQQTNHRLPLSEATLHWLEAAEKTNYNQQGFGAIVKFIREQA